jgi:hypothetical protein
MKTPMNQNQNHHKYIKWKLKIWMSEGEEESVIEPNANVTFNNDQNSQGEQIADAEANNNKSE